MIRRQFLRTCLGTLGALLAAPARPGTARSASPRFQISTRASELEHWFAYPDAAARIGKRYLASRAPVDEPGMWLKQAGFDPESTSKASDADFRQRREADFLLGQTVLVDGWILARTELAACVVLALARDPSLRQ